MNRAARILYLEDIHEDVLLAEAALARGGCPCELLWARDRRDFESMILDPALDLVISDYHLPDFDGLAALAMCRKARPLLPFILVSGMMGEERAVECLRQGATDYVLKGNLRRLAMVVGRALDEVEERRAYARAEKERVTLLEAATIARVVPWRQEMPSGAWIFGESVAVVLGVPPQDFKADPSLAESLIHREDLHRLYSAQAASARGKRAGFDCRMQLRDGPWAWTRWTLASSAEGYHGVLQDITELHTTQDQLIQSQKAETASTLVSGLCHDFNNLIGAISVGSDLLLLEGLPEQQGKTVATIQRAAGRAGDLVRQLLDFARKNRETRLVRQVLDDLAREAEGLLRHALRADIHLETEFAAGGAEVLAEPGQIIQVALNLGINARDAIQGPGRVTLRTGCQELGAPEAEAHDRPPGSYAFLEVADTGAGIPPEILAKIYDPFFTTKPPGKGTGLGLTMVQAIVKGHDGILQCHSELGKGTRFRILLPVAPQAQTGGGP